MHNKFCFNPCFGGFCSKTQQVKELRNELEQCFNPCFGGFCSKTEVRLNNLFELLSVSILVLVDFALKRKKSNCGTGKWKSFNPCFGGFCSKTRPTRQKN